MGDDGKENKGGGGEALTIRVNLEAEKSISVKLKQSTQMRRVIAAACKAFHLDKSRCKFFHAETCIREEDTPLSLNMEHGSKVEVVRDRPIGVHGNAEAEILTLFVKAQGQNPIKVRMKFHDRMEKLMALACETFRIEPQYCRFYYESVNINKGNTPRQLEIEDGDEISIFLQQDGGGLFQRLSTPSSLVPSHEHKLNNVYFNFHIPCKPAHARDRKCHQCKDKISERI